MSLKSITHPRRYIIWGINVPKFIGESFEIGSLKTKTCTSPNCHSVHVLSFLIECNVIKTVLGAWSTWESYTQSKIG